jgi:hypothetical protein
MKKTVQIVTIPLNKEGWSKGDLIKLIAGTPYLGGSYFALAGRYIKEKATNYQRQQLLVLSDDEIQKGDVRLLPKEHSMGRIWKIANDLRNNTFRMRASDGACQIYHRETLINGTEYGKIIASYPQLEGTLPISKETVQAWIDSGTPGEGSIKYAEIEPNKLLGDSDGNLLLEFGNQIDRNYPEEYELTQDDAKEWCESIKPPIPTDEEIEKKATDKYPIIEEENYGNVIVIIEDSLYEERQGFVKGYKQALKDMGYE